MSLKAIERVSETEKAVRARRTAAETEAKQIIAEAEQRGNVLLNRIRTDADAEGEKMKLEAEERAGRRAEEISRQAQAENGKLHTAAEARLEKTAALIVERVVK